MELTSEERKWINSLKRVLAKCPSDRFGAYTIGDANITLFDATKSDEITAIMDSSNYDFCNAVADAGAEIESISFPFQVHSTAG